MFMFSVIKQIKDIFEKSSYSDQDFTHRPAVDFYTYLGAQFRYLIRC